MRKLILLFLLAATRLEAANITVGPGGTHATLAAALAVATGGDIILMEEDATFTACTVLPDKGNQTAIQIRSSAADGNLPAAGVRFDPATHGTRVAILTACSGGASAISMAPGAQDYIIGPGLKFTSTPGGFNNMLSLGSNSSSQDLLSEQPGDIVVDRNWFAGDPIVGQKVGIDMNGRSITVSNNYIDEIHAIGQDAIGVRCVNGSGPYVITNNFIAATGENFLCGGDDPQMRTSATVNAGATTTTATLSSLSGGHAISELKVGQLIVFLAGANTARYHTYVRSCGTSTEGAACSSATITYDALPGLPDTGTGSDARFGTIPNGFTIRRNHFYKRLAWRDPIIGQVGTVTPTASTPGGAAVLPAGSYYYKVVARNNAGYNGNSYYGTASAESVVCTLTAIGQCALAWSAVTNATHYRVYRGTSPGAQTGYFEVTTNAATDIGLALTTATIPTATRWVVKNLFEIKFGTNYQIDSNKFENSWVGSDNGQGVWLKANNSVGNAEFAQTKNVIWEKNWIVNVPGCFNILGRNENAENAPAPLENLIIRNSACTDSDSSWLDAGDPTTYAFYINEPIVGLTLENNTIIHKMKGLMYFIATSGPQTTGFIARNNIWRAESLGVFASGYTCTKGTSCLNAAVPGWVYAGNVTCGASSSTYPSGNLYPTVVECEGSTHFEDYANDDYRLKSGSSWKTTAVGGGDPGVNWDVLNSALTGVTTGAAESTTPPNITTTTPITPITQGATCTLTFAATGGTSPYVWTKTTGTYPTSCTVSSAGVFSGTTTTPGTFTFTMRATDAVSAFDDQAFTWVINPTSSTLAFVTSGTIPAGEVTNSFELQLQASGGTAPYSYDVTVGSVPTWATLTPSGLYSGVPNSTTAASFTARVTDAVGATATRAFTQTINAESMTCSGGPGPRQRFFRVNGLTFEGSLFRRPTPPTTSWPDCAKKLDIWQDTSTGRSYQVSGISPLAFTFIGSAASSSDGVIVDGIPQLNDIIIGNDAGGWQRISIADLTGLDAASITTGVIDPARLPWRAPVFYTLSADVTKSSTGFGDITGLSFPVLANTNYDVVCQIAATSATATTGFGIGWVGPASPTLTSGQWVSVIGSQSVGGSQIEGNDTGSATSATNSASPNINPGVFMGMWRNGATAGTVQMRFRPEIADTVVIKAGSYCKVTTF